MTAHIPLQPPAPTPAVEIDEAALDRAVAHDAAGLIYLQEPRVMTGTVLTALGIGAVTWGTIPGPPLLAWIASFMLLMVLRVRDLRCWRARQAAHARSLEGTASHWPMPADDGNGGSDALRRVSWLIYATGALWGLFPVLFMPYMDNAGKTGLVMLFAGMVAANMSLLALVSRVSWIFATLVIVPMAAMLMLEETALGRIAAFGSILLLSTLIAGNRQNSQAAQRALRLARVNGMLMQQEQALRHRTTALNQRLESAQQALTEINASLEARVAARTEALETEIRERNRVARRLADLASSDPMTGLANRARLEEVLAERIRGDGRDAGGLAVLFIDLDRFKDVNDAMGHLAGDSVLRTVGARLQAGLPADALAARWGGDEFVVVLPTHGDDEVAMDVGRQVRALVAEPIPLQADLVRIDASVGIAIHPADGTDAETLVRSADMAVYAAKVSGRAAVRRFEESMYSRLRERHAMSQALRQAIDEDRLELAYQPLVESATGRVRGFEALTRWRDGERGWVSPAEFIPIAEESGSIVALGRWVLLTACRAAAGWSGEDGPSVAVNVSAAQIMAGDFPKVVDEALAQSELAPQRLTLELTESFFAQEAERLTRVLARIRARGVRIAIDDFGTGYSSLAMLRSLPVDELKIDRAFVEDAGEHGGTFVEAIQTIARSLSLSVTAEGVETDTQRDLLARLGVELLQGYLIARPMPEAQAREWLARAATHADPRSTDERAAAAIAARGTLSRRAVSGAALHFDESPPDFCLELPDDTPVLPPDVMAAHASGQGFASGPGTAPRGDFESSGDFAPLGAMPVDLLLPTHAGPPAAAQWPVAGSAPSAEDRPTSAVMPPTPTASFDAGAPA